MIMIRFENVSKTYGSRVILEHISVTFKSGGFYILTGPSGAGKTTFLRLASGKALPDSGEVYLFEKKRRILSRAQLAQIWRRLGIMDQATIFLDHLNLIENILLPLWAGGIPVDEQRQKDLLSLLEWVGLSERKEAFPPELSGGERQRAALARAVIRSPDVIIADEPTGNIDPEMSLRLLNLLITLNEMGKTILMATHDRGLIRNADQAVDLRMMRLKAGHLELSGNWEAA